MTRPWPSKLRSYPTAERAGDDCAVSRLTNSAWEYDAATGGKPEIHGDGLQSRDFIYVLDTVDATIKLYDVLPAGKSMLPGRYMNEGSSGRWQRTLSPEQAALFSRFAPELAAFGARLRVCELTPDGRVDLACLRGLTSTLKVGS